MTYYQYEVSIECNKPKFVIYYNSDFFPDLENIKEYNKSIICDKIQNNLFCDITFETLDDIIGVIDLTHILEIFNETDAPVIKHQEYFKFAATYLLVSISRVAALQRAFLSTHSDINHDIFRQKNEIA